MVSKPNSVSVLPEELWRTVSWSYHWTIIFRDGIGLVRGPLENRQSGGSCPRSGQTHIDGFLKKKITLLPPCTFRKQVNLKYNEWKIICKLRKQCYGKMLKSRRMMEHWKIFLNCFSRIQRVSSKKLLKDWRINFIGKGVSGCHNYITIF